MFTALLKKCIEKGVIAICRHTARNNTPPRFVALFPQVWTDHCNNNNNNSNNNNNNTFVECRSAVASEPLLSFYVCNFASESRCVPYTVQVFEALSLSIQSCIAHIMVPCSVL